MKLTKQELRQLLEIAKRAASLAATVHRRAMNAGDLKVHKKRSTCDLVTEIDRESERELVRAIRAARQNDEIVGRREHRLAAVPVCDGFLILWTEQQTSYTDILHTRWRSESKLTDKV